MVLAHPLVLYHKWNLFVARSWKWLNASKSQPLFRYTVTDVAWCCIIKDCFLEGGTFTEDSCLLFRVITQLKTVILIHSCEVILVLMIKLENPWCTQCSAKSNRVLTKKSSTSQMVLHFHPCVFEICYVFHPCFFLPHLISYSEKQISFFF